MRLVLDAGEVHGDDVERERPDRVPSLVEASVAVLLGIACAPAATWVDHNVENPVALTKWIILVAGIAAWGTAAHRWKVINRWKGLVLMIYFLTALSFIFALR